jgi:carbonic anhydrase
MACNAPLDIAQSEASKCELKCQFHFNYGNSGCTVVNNGDRLTVDYDGTSDVVFNSQKYTATKLLIFKPSLHTYNGKRADAEMLLRHKNGTNELFVCIPITKTGPPSSGSELLSQIINNAPIKDKNSHTFSVPDFNANLLIPSCPYFTYTGTLLYGDCTDQEYNYIVFHPRDGYISLPEEDLTHLGKMLETTEVPTFKGDLFFNEKGTKSNGFSGDGELYMSCQPTGESEEEIIFKESDTPNNSDTLKKAFVGLVGFFIIVVMFYLAKTMISYISKNKNQTTILNELELVSKKTSS